MNRYIIYVLVLDPWKTVNRVCQYSPLRRDVATWNVICCHRRIAARNITLTNSVVAYNDVRKHKNMGAERRREMRRLIPSFSRCARAVYEPLASIARELTVSWRISSSLGEDDFLIQINAFSKITRKLVTCQPYLCVHKDFFLVSLLTYLLINNFIVSRFNTKNKNRFRCLCSFFL